MSRRDGTRWSGTTTPRRRSPISAWMPSHIGRGLGRWMLSAAIDHAWAVGRERIWLHTCTLDHAAAFHLSRSRLQDIPAGDVRDRGLNSAGDLSCRQSREPKTLPRIPSPPSTRLGAWRLSMN